MSRSTTSLDKSQSFLSSVISSAKPFARASGTPALGPSGAAGSVAPGAQAGHRMLGKKLFGGARPRSSSKSRASSLSHQASSWTPTVSQTLFSVGTNRRISGWEGNGIRLEVHFSLSIAARRRRRHVALIVRLPQGNKAGMRDQEVKWSVNLVRPST